MTRFGCWFKPDLAPLRKLWKGRAPEQVTVLLCVWLGLRIDPNCACASPAAASATRTVTAAATLRRPQTTPSNPCILVLPTSRSADRPTQFPWATYTIAGVGKTAG